MLRLGAVRNGFLKYSEVGRLWRGKMSANILVKILNLDKDIYIVLVYNIKTKRKDSCGSGGNNRAGGLKVKEI